MPQSTRLLRLPLLVLVIVAIGGCGDNTLTSPRLSPGAKPAASLELAGGLVDIRVSFNGEVLPREAKPNHDPNTEPDPYPCDVRIYNDTFFTQDDCASPLSVPAGEYTLSVIWHRIELVNERKTIKVGDADVRVIELGDRAARISGRTTQNGQPAPGHYVCSYIICITSGADGRFSLVVEPVAGYINGTTYPAPAPGSSVDIGDLDEQVGFMRIDVVRAGSPVSTDYNSCGAMLPALSYTTVQCNTLQALSPSQGTLDVRWMGLTLLSESYTLAAGQTLTWTIDVADRASVVTGTLSFNGTPQPKRTFAIQDNYQIFPTTDEAGRFSVVVPRGAPQLIIGSYGTSFTKVIGASGPTTDMGIVDFALPAVRGKVVYGTQPLTQCRLRIWFPNQGLAEQECDGSTTVVPPGEYRVTAAYAGVTLGEKSGVLAAGQTLSLDIDASTLLGRITGVLRLAGRPLPAGRYVCAQASASSFDYACTVTDASGSISLPVAPGSGQLFVDSFKFPYQVRAGETVDVGGGPASAPTPGDTRSGQGISVAPVDPVTGATPATITFGNVLTPGVTTVTTSTFTNGHVPPPEGQFSIGGNKVLMDISTTATFDGTITVCLNYGQLATTGNPKTFRLLHFDSNTGRWVNITTSNDLVAQVICGETSSLSPFTVAQANPVIATPAGLTVLTDPGVCQATITLGSPGATTEGDLASVIGVRNDALPLAAPYVRGLTVVTWTATDGDGLTAVAEQRIVVNDGEKPALSAPSSIVVNTDPGRATASVNVGIPGVRDNCGATVSGARTDGKALGDPYPVGMTTILWTATDDAHNVATASQTVAVRDAEAPVLTVPADQVVNATMPTGALVSFALSATDNVGVASTSCDRATGSVFPIGATTVSCRALDAAGNAAAGSFQVTVLGAPEQIANLAELVSGLAIPATVRTQLVASLQTALGDPRSTKVACSALNSFITLVKLRSGTVIPTDRAVTLVADATRIRAVIGCP